jgi:hypothetical protein
LVVGAIVVGLIALLRSAPNDSPRSASFLQSDWRGQPGDAANPPSATDKWPWLKTPKMLEEETAQRTCLKENERIPGRNEDCSLPKVRERLARSTPVAPATPRPSAAAARNVEKAADRTQDALARQLQAMPGVSRW